MGIMYHKTNRFQEALSCYGKVLKKIPHDKTVHISRGVVYSDMGNHVNAIKDFTRAIEIDPKFSEAYFRRGMSKLAAKLFHEAISDLRMSEDYEKDDRNPGIPDGLAQCFHKLKDYTEAIGYYNSAIREAETNTEFLMHRAQCFYDQKKWNQSIQDLKNGLELASTDA